MNNIEIVSDRWENVLSHEGASQEARLFRMKKNGRMRGENGRRKKCDKRER